MLEIAQTNSPGSTLRLARKPCELLKAAQQTEVLTFLSLRPQHTFVMSGWIRDNGLVSPLNRGTFYGHRNAHGRLDGVALIGHVTLFETNNEVALAAFARLAQNSSETCVVMGESDKVSQFLSYYRREGQRPRLMYREQLLERRRKHSVDAAVPGLRLATLADLKLVAPVHAQMAFEESGVDPLQVDAEGFFRRCARRIEQKRVWVKVENNELIFKADIISDSSEVVYLEGVFVNPEKRGQGVGQRCLRDLTNELLQRTKSVCLLVNQRNSAAQGCYQKAGYELRDHYDTLYLGKPQSELLN
jgi:predicted GNAT family acetyltransferase